MSQTATADNSPSRGLRERFRGDWRYQMGAIIALALIPRMAYLAQIVHWPFFYFPVLDSRTQYQWAESLVRTLGMGTPEVMAKPPLYAYFLALNQALFGQGNPSLFSARLLQLALSAVTCGLAYLVGKRVFGTTAGIAAGILAAAYSPGVFNDGELLDTALAAFLATSLLLLVLRALDDPSPNRWLGCGMVLGLLGLTRGNMLLLAFWALGLLAVYLRGRLGVKGLIRRAAMFVLGILLIILPITARNFLISGRFVLIASNAGINLYTGNNPQADGYSPIPAGIEWERTWYAAIDAGVFDVTDRYWTGRALEFWRTQPGKALLLLLKKAVLYWNAYEIPNNVSYEWGREHASVLRLLPLRFGGLAALGLLGMAFGGWRTRRAAARAWRRDRTGGRRPWLTLLGCGALLLAMWTVVHADWYGLKKVRKANRDWFYLGQSYHRAKRGPEAKAALMKAVEVNPSSAPWRLHRITAKRPPCWPRSSSPTTGRWMTSSPSSSRPRGSSDTMSRPSARR